MIVRQRETTKRISVEEDHCPRNVDRSRIDLENKIALIIRNNEAARVEGFDYSAAMNFALHGLLLQAFLSILNFQHGLLPPCSASEAIKYLDFHNLPDTNFSCQGKVIGGYYADLETGCQMFHVCTIGQKDEIMDIRFLCLNGTIFDQETRVCERVDEVDCSKSEQFYNLNLELYGNNAVTFGLHESDDEDNPSDTVENSQRTTSAHPTAGTTTTTTSRPTKPSTTTVRGSYQHSTGYPQQQFRQGYHHQYILHNDERNDNQATSYQLFSNQGVSSTTVQEVPQAHQIRFSSTPNPQIIRNEPSTISPIFHITSSTIQTLLDRNPSNPALINPIYNNHGIVSTTESFNVHNPRDTSEYRDNEHRKHGITPLEAIQSTNKGKISKLSISPVPSQEEQKDSQTSQQQRISSNILPTPASVETTIKSFYPTPRTSPKPSASTTSSNGQIIQHIHVPPPIPVPQLKPHHITINLPPPDIQRIIQNPPPPLLPSQSRVIVTAKASVSDETGRPLNTTQLVTIPIPTIPANYDDYKEGDESFDPFYRDVPKLRNHRRAIVRKVEKVYRRKRSLTEIDDTSTIHKETNFNSKIHDVHSMDKNLRVLKRHTDIFDNGQSKEDRKIDIDNKDMNKTFEKRMSHVRINNDHIFEDLETKASRHINLNSDEQDEEEEKEEMEEEEEEEEQEEEEGEEEKEEEVEEEEEEEEEEKNNQNEKISERVEKESDENVDNIHTYDIEVLDLNEYVDSETNSNLDATTELTESINNTNTNDDNSFEVTWLLDSNITETANVDDSQMISYNNTDKLDKNEQEREIEIVSDIGMKHITNSDVFTLEKDSNKNVDKKQNKTNKIAKSLSIVTNSSILLMDKKEEDKDEQEIKTSYDNSKDKIINDNKDYLYDDEEEDEMENNSDKIDNKKSNNEEIISSRMMEDIIATTEIVDTSKTDIHTKKLHSRISRRKMSAKRKDQKEYDSEIDIIDSEDSEGHLSTNTSTSHFERNFNEQIDNYDSNKSNIRDVKAIDSTIKYSSKFVKDITSNKENVGKKLTQINNVVKYDSEETNVDNLGKINNSSKYQLPSDKQETLESSNESLENKDESNKENGETTEATYISLENSEEKIDVTNTKVNSYTEEISMEQYQTTNDVSTVNGKDKEFEKNSSEISDENEREHLESKKHSHDRTKMKLKENYSSEEVYHKSKHKNITDTNKEEFQLHENSTIKDIESTVLNEDIIEYDYPMNQSDYTWDNIDDYKESVSIEDFTASIESDNHEQVTESYETITNSAEVENSELIEQEDSTTGVLKFIDELPRMSKTESNTEKDIVSVEPAIQDYVDDNYEPHNYKEQESLMNNTENPNDDKIEKDIKVVNINEKLSKNIDYIKMDNIKMEKEGLIQEKDTKEFAKFIENNEQQMTIVPISKSTIEPLTLSTLISSTMSSTTLSVTSLPSITTVLPPETTLLTTTTIPTITVPTVTVSTTIPTTLPTTVQTITVPTTTVPTTTVPTTTISTTTSTTTLPTTTPITTTRSVPNLFKPFSLRKNYNYIPPTTTPNPVIIKSRLPLFNPKPAKPPKSYNELVPKPVIRKITLPTRRPPTTMPTSTIKKSEELNNIESTTTKYVENLSATQIVGSSTDSTDSQFLNSNIENFTSYPSTKLSTLSTVTDVTSLNSDTSNNNSDTTETSTITRDIINEDTMDISTIPTVIPTVIDKEYIDEKKHTETMEIKTSVTTGYYHNDVTVATTTENIHSNNHQSQHLVQL
ncbi:rho GTPase-activating protein gacF-like isoform X1 [Vespa mandarinia]|uniref:rho GTPase-activating protein gacF-like isoform X1 n=3 Tax=Vespa mandarinia TaxID=7446 RepID=UPI001614AC67|nr:rho GTPase-activating protein gacF-like isoform X1 [Vespa mandarinia]